tara:strand:- start:1263 stop:2201 length:939 start_codon:yes stop_codon:yes gene_type:complete
MGKGGNTTQTTTQAIPAFIQDQVKEVFGEVENFTPSSAIVPEIAGFTPNQTSAQTLIKNLATGSPLAGSKTALDNILTGEFSVSDPLQTLLDDTLSKTVNNVTSQYSSAGRLGSDAFGTALGEGIASGVAPTLANALESDASRKLSAVGMMPSILSSELGLLGALSGVGAEERAYNQSLLDRPAQTVSATNQANQQRINNLIAALGGAPTPTSTTSSKSPSNLDAMTAAALAATAIFSDRRLKSDIKKIGTHSTGLNLYEWEWNAKAFVLGLDKHPRKGFIAQEVQKVFPEAVVEGSHGYLMIDYSKIKEVA